MISSILKYRIGNVVEALSKVNELAAYYPFMPICVNVTAIHERSFKLLLN